MRRRKRWAAISSEAAKYCLSSAGLGLADVDYAAVNRDTSANLLSQVLFSLSKRPSLEAIEERLSDVSNVRENGALLKEQVSDGRPARFQVHNVEYHGAPMASSFNISPFETVAFGRDSRSSGLPSPGPSGMCGSGRGYHPTRPEATSCFGKTALRRGRSAGMPRPWGSVFASPSFESASARLSSLRPSAVRCPKVASPIPSPIQSW